MTTIQPLQFAALGWFYRYEAYLIVLALTGLGVALGYEPARLGWRYWLSPRPLPYYAALALTTAFFGPPIWTRAVQASDRVVAASYTIYGQQYQMAHFVERYYQGQGVVANDVGAISDSEWAKSYGGILPEWVLVGRWTVSDNVVFVQATIALYAPNQKAVPALTCQLQEFGKTIPERLRRVLFRVVDLRGLWTQTAVSHGSQ